MTDWAETLTLDDTDRQIIEATQEGLPLCPRPYHAVAEQLGLDGNDVMARLERMLAAGVIRRIGAVPNHYRLGFKANGMTVWDVPDQYITSAGRSVGALSFVSHCYHRPRRLPDWRFNLFAMVHGRDRSEVEEKSDGIAEILGHRFRARDVLYSTRILKKTGFRLVA